MGVGAWPWVPIAVPDPSGQLKQPGHIPELLQTCSGDGSWVGPPRPSLQALGANVYVLRPSIGATSLGHWKSSSLEAAGGAADGVLDPIKGVPLTHREGCLSSQPSLQDVWSPCHHPSPPPGHGSAEHFPVCRGGLLPGSRWKDLLLCSPKDSAVVIFLS